MLLVIFGAGASYDSDPAQPPGTHHAVPWRPPLANELFSRQEFRRLFPTFPRMHPLIPRLAGASDRRPLERMLKEIEDEALNYSARASELAAIRYYLQSLIWESEQAWVGQTQGVTNYLALLDRIHLWAHGKPDVVFVTFNYDRLFEIASSHYFSGGKSGLGNRYKTLESYIDGSMLQLIKPHGSIDWGYRVMGGLPRIPLHNWDYAHLATEHFASLQLADVVEKTEKHPPEPKENGGFVPAIAIPVDEKSTFVCPDAHMQHLRRRLREVTHVLSIGWRGMEQHFLNLLAEELPMKARAMAVANNRAGSEDTLSRIKGPQNAVVHPTTFDGGFSQFVVSVECDQFLARAVGPGTR